MRIGHLISNYFPKVGGAQICVHHVAERCTEKGHDVVVATTALAGGSDRRFKYRIAPLNPLLNKLLHYNFALGKAYLERALKRLERERKFDVWQVTVGYPFGAASADFFNKNGTPCILRCTGEDLQMAPALKYGYRLDARADRLIRDNYRHFTAFVALSDSVKKDYVSLGIPPEKIHIIPNGVDLSRFNIGVDDEKIKDELGVKRYHRLILTVGRNHPKKGFTYIPRIIKRLAKERTDFRWLLVGKGSSKIKSLADKEGVGNFLITKEMNPSVSDKGRFEVPSKELIQCYKASDVFVFPTLIETFGMVLIEAMAAGLPIVTTDAPGVKDVIRDNENGLKNRVADVEGMAESILKLFSDEALSHRLSENALRDSKNYDWVKVTDMYLELYERAIEEHPPSATILGGPHPTRAQLYSNGEEYRLWKR